MSVRFIIGRAGSGKTRYCLEQIVELLRGRPLGPAVFWLLPRQATFQAERQLACASGLGAFSRARVVSFDTLAEQILGECGGSAIPEVTPLGRQMILGHLLRQSEKELKFFTQVARHPGLAAKLDATLEELQRCGREPEELETLFRQIVPTGQVDARDPNPFHAKLHDLCLLFKSYTAFVGQERLDPGQRLAHVLGSISRSRLLRGATLFVDGFLEFDAPQRQILTRLAQVCARVEITVLMDGDSAGLPAARAPLDELSLFHRTQHQHQRLSAAFYHEAIPLDPPLLLREPRRFANPALVDIERRAFGAGGASAHAPQGIVLVEAPSRRAEVDAAARQIRELVAGGLRYREIALLVRHLEEYADLIAASFAEHAIPYFVDRRRTMAHHPLLQFVRAALAIARHNWPHDAAMQLLKTGLAGLGEAEADLLENYVLEHRIRGATWSRGEPWAWCRRLTRPSDDADPEPDESREAERLRQRICQHFRPFLSLAGNARTRLPLRQIAAALFELLERFGVPATLSTWIADARQASDPEQAGEHEQVWAELVGLFEQMVDLLGEEAVSLDEFNDVLEAGLETFDLALAPPTVDQVLVGPVDRTRTPDLKAALVLGLSEGTFPAAPRDTSILSDPDRAELQKRQFDVDPGTERRLLDENLLGYLALTRASHHLYLSRFTCDEKGRTVGASVFWTRVTELFPGISILRLPRDERSEPRLISTPRQLLTALMLWARSGVDPAGDSTPWPALYHWLAAHPAQGDPLDVLRYWAWKALQYDNSALLSAESAQRLFPAPLLARPQQVEMFATCAFRHFLRHGLRLQRRDDEEYEAINLENAFHDLMDRLVRDMLRRETDWASLTPEQTRTLVHLYAEQIGQTLHGEMMLSNARNQYMLARIEKALESVVATQQAMATRSGFRTSHARVAYGGEHSKLPPLEITTPKGRRVELRGQIDRVDILYDQSAFTVMDYRTMGAELSLGRAQHGLNLSLMANLLALQAHGEKLAGQPLSPAAAFYVRLLRQLESVEHPSDGLACDDPRFPLRGAKLRGLFDASFLPELDAGCEPGSSSDILSARLNKNGELGAKGQGDYAEPEEFAAFLESIRERIGILADQILDGQIDIRPYRINTSVPCSTCGYRSVCRFDPALNRYNTLSIPKREEVLADALERRRKREGSP